MDVRAMAGTPDARRVFLTAIALALGNSPDRAGEIVSEFLAAVGNPTREVRELTLGTLGLPEVSPTHALAAEWGRIFLRKTSLSHGRVSYGFAETIGPFLFFIAYAETIGPAPGDENMDWYETLARLIETVWMGDADAFHAHVAAACRETANP